MTDEPPAPDAPAAAKAAKQKNNPLHGLTLETIVTALVDHYGFEELGRRIDIRCFQENPSVASSLKFLRKTPWARDKVESFYLFMGREKRRAAAPTGGTPGAPASETPASETPASETPASETPETSET